MKYRFKDDAISMPFMVPASIVDKYLKLTNENQLKVILFLLRNLSSGIDVDMTAEGLSIPKSEVEDALLYWQQCGIIQGEEPVETAKQQEKKTVIPKTEKPSRSDVARRGLEDENIAILLREAQMKFGRNLKSNESSTLVWLYDDEGMEISLILILLQYAVSEGKCNIRFVERTAAIWMENGIETVSDAEAYIAKTAKQKLAWSVVQKAFSIEARRPSTKELELSDKWLNEWKLSAELLVLAYDECVNAKSKFIMRYVESILENWYKDGITTPEQLKKKQDSDSAGSNDSGGVLRSAAYDIDLFEKMLNKDD